MKLDYISSHILAQQSKTRIAIATSAFSTILFSIQALISNIPFQNWQLIYFGSNVSTFFAGLLLGKKTKKDFFYLLPLINSFIAPIWIGSKATSSWLSIGLVTMIIATIGTIIFTSIVSIFFIASLGIAHILMAKLNFSSISDLRDTLLLGGYFSIVWNIGLAAVLLYAVNRYMKVSDSIDEEIENKYLNFLNSIQKITKLNRQDWQNVKLHGTVLNSLISVRNILNQGDSIKNVIPILKMEIADLQGTSDISSRFATKLKNLTSIPEFQGISFEISGSGDFHDITKQNNFLEYCREILLNTSKHTDANRILINYNISNKNRVKIEIRTFLSNPNLQGALDSKTLRRLLDLIDAEFQVQQYGESLLYKIESSPTVQSELEVEDLRKFRDSGIVDFGIDLTRGAVILSALTVLGNLFIKTSFFAIALMFVHTALMALSIFPKKRNQLIIALSTAFTLLVQPLLFMQVADCSRASFLVWQFDMSLTGCFIALMHIDRKVVKWIPITIFSLTSIILPIGLPVGCQNLLFGSIPGIAIILILAIRLTGFRARAIAADEVNILGIYANDVELEAIRIELNNEFAEVIEGCKHLVSLYEKGNLSPAELIRATEIQIQLIRNFLLSSEQFESKTIRAYYDFIKRRLKSGFLTRAGITGDHFYLDSEVSEIERVLSEIEVAISSSHAEVRISNVPELNLNIILFEENSNSLKALQEISENSKKISLSVNSA